MTKTADGSRTIWALTSGLTVPGDSDAGRVLFRGQWVTLTPEQVESTKDRLGNSWLDLDADAQVKRWDEQRFAEGLPPEGILIGGDDSMAMSDQRKHAEAELRFIADPEQRRAAQNKILADFGRGNPSAQRSERRG